MDQLIPLIVAVVLIAIAWKVLKGIIKTAALVIILGAVAYFVFLGGGMANAG